MAKTVILGRDHPEIQSLLEQMQEHIKRGSERHDFLQKQLKNLLKEHEERKASLWREIEETIDQKGLAPEDKKATAMSWEADFDVMCVKEREPRDQHPLAAILGGMFQQ